MIFLKMSNLSDTCVRCKGTKYREITKDVNDHIKLLVRIAHIICNHLYVRTTDSPKYNRYLRNKYS